MSDGRINVVIVDDHPLVRAAPKPCSTKAWGLGCRALAASAAASALAVVREHEPDVLLLDGESCSTDPAAL